MNHSDQQNNKFSQKRFKNQIKIDRFIPQRKKTEQQFRKSTNKRKESENSNFYQQILYRNFCQENKPRNPFSFTNQSKQKQISQIPFKILDAPYLQDDYYLNVIDWGFSNNLAVGLRNTVYIWNFTNNKVQKLIDFSDFNLVSAVKWNEDNLLFVGALNGLVQVWDVEYKKRIFQWNHHLERVGALSVKRNHLLTGSRDKSIHYFDIRCPTKSISVYHLHQQEVCGLSWSPDQEFFLSGGNDNKMYVCSTKTDVPIFKKTHRAAVRALGWSPHKRGFFATGGGTADRCLRTWSLQKRKLVNCVETNSQICSLLFSRNQEEIITSHGFSTFEINIWGKKLKKLNTLRGHQQRVLYLSESPCGKYIVSGAGDETLRFWNTQDKIKSISKIQKKQIFQKSLRQLNYLMKPDSMQREMIIKINVRMKQIIKQCSRVSFFRFGFV